jgi:hypothetical protein
MDKVGAHNFLPATERFCWVREQQGRFQGRRFVVMRNIFMYATIYYFQ